MKIKKLQGGGFATFTPIVPMTPTAAIRPETKKDEEKSENSSLLDKDVYKKLMDAGGLVNDVNYFVEQVAKLEASKNPYLDSSNSLSALQLIGQVNELVQSKKYWDESLGNAKASGGLGEVAVDSTGRMFVQDEEGIKSISPTEYLKLKNKPNVLTVADLLNARQYNKELVGNKSIFNVANESIGIKNITDRIMGMMDLLSEASVSSERHYSKQQILGQLAKISGKAPTEEELAAVRDLTEIANTPGDYFKVISENKGKRKNIDKALNYIWSTLDMNAQNKLRAVATLNGETNEKKLIYDMLFTYTEPSISSKIIPEDEESVLGKKTNKDDEKSLTLYQLFAKDKLNDPLSTFAFNDPRLGVLFRGSVGAVGALVTEKDESIPMTTLQNVLKGFGWDRLVDSDKASFGSKNIELFNRNNVIYDGNTVAKVYMPVGKDGAPDYDEFNNFKEIYSEYEKIKSSISAQEAERLFSDHGYHIKIDDNGREKIIRDNPYVKPFLVMYGYTNDATGLTEDNQELIKLSKTEKEQILPWLTQAWTVGTGKNTRDLTPDASFNREDYYKGIIAIPFRKEHAAYADAIVGQGPTEKVPTILDVQRNIRNSSNIPQQINADSGILNIQ